MVVDCTASWHPDQIQTRLRQARQLHVNTSTYQQSVETAANAGPAMPDAQRTDHARRLESTRTDTNRSRDGHNNEQTFPSRSASSSARLRAFPAQGLWTLPAPTTAAAPDGRCVRRRSRAQWQDARLDESKLHGSRQAWQSHCTCMYTSQHSQSRCVELCQTRLGCRLPDRAV